MTATRIVGRRGVRKAAHAASPSGIRSPRRRSRIDSTTHRSLQRDAVGATGDGRTRLGSTRVALGPRDHDRPTAAAARLGWGDVVRSAGYSARRHGRRARSRPRASTTDWSTRATSPPTTAWIAGRLPRVPPRAAATGQHRLRPRSDRRASRAGRLRLDDRRPRHPGRDRLELAHRAQRARRAQRRRLGGELGDRLADASPPRHRPRAHARRTRERARRGRRTRGAHRHRGHDLRPLRLCPCGASGDRSPSTGAARTGSDRMPRAACSSSTPQTCARSPRRSRVAPSRARPARSTAGRRILDRVLGLVDPDGEQLAAQARRALRRRARQPPGLRRVPGGSRAQRARRRRVRLPRRRDRRSRAGALALPRRAGLRDERARPAALGRRAAAMAARRPPSDHRVRRRRPPLGSRARPGRRARVAPLRHGRHARHRRHRPAAACRGSLRARRRRARARRGGARRRFRRAGRRRDRRASGSACTSWGRSSSVACGRRCWPGPVESRLPSPRAAELADRMFLGQRTPHLSIWF